MQFSLVLCQMLDAAEYVCKEGDLADEMFYLFDGEVEVEKGGVTVATLKRVRNAVLLFWIFDCLLGRHFR